MNAPLGHTQIATAAASLEAEQSLLGAALLDAETAWPSIASTGLRPQHFDQPEHALIFAAVEALRERGEPVDIITVHHELQGRGTDARSIELQYINALAASVPSAHNAGRYAEIVAEMARRREVEAVARGLAAAASSAGVAANQFHASLAEARAELDRIAEQRTQAPPFAALPLSNLAGIKIEAPAWIWQGLVPQGHVTVLSGHGGVGKSLIALMLCVAVAVGRPLFNVPTHRCKVAFYSGEDHAQLLLHRLLWICEEMDVDPADLNGWLHVLDATDGDPALFHEVQVAGVRSGMTTGTYAELGRYLDRYQIELLVVDNMSDTFDAPEIERARVRAFMRSLPRLRRRRVLSVLLLAHVDKGTARGDRNGTESYSGSTAVHNSARSRLAALRDKDGALRIEHQKCNVGPLRTTLALLWPEDGLPQADVPQSGHMQAIVRTSELRAVLRLIDEFSSRGEWVSTSINSASSAPRLLSGEPSYPRGRRPAEVQALLRDAERDQLLQRVEYRNADRKARERWALTTAGKVAINGGAPGAPGPR